MKSQEERVLEYLAKTGRAKATQIAIHLELKHKREINPLLYRMKSAGKADKDGDHYWFLKPSANKSPTREKAALSSGPPAPPVLQVCRIRPANARKSVGEIVWTSEQSAVIEGQPTARILIEAGPGTGKTAVACARVAKLLSRDQITPSSILMISFTRTAVAEMKKRIRLWADSGRVNAVQIATLDQTAFAFGIGCGEKFERLMDGFEGNIKNAVEQLQAKNPLLTEYVTALRHVIIDEAQDLTGPRSQLVRLLIEALPETVGVTIFADQAQAIYGFTTDLDGDHESNEQFLQAFNVGKQGFQRAELQQIHRTQEPSILNLFTESRNALLNGGIEKVIQVAESATQCLGSDIQQLPLEDGDLVLYRKRASALMHAQFCPSLFRLRLPNYPAAVYPWIGLVFSNWTAPYVSRNDFVRLWDGHVQVEMRDDFTAELAWELLVRFANDRDRVKISRIRTLISRPRPPVEFCYLDYGGTGPVFSTIHASKGREAERVFLMLPRNLDYIEGNSVLDRVEEARVFYVGSTRVKSEFLRGRAQTLVGAGRIDESGRRVGQIISIRKRPKFQVGLAGDVDDVAPISRTTHFCPSDAAAAAHQKKLIEIWSTALKENRCHEINASSEQLAASGPSKEYRYRFTSGGSTVAWSAPGLLKDLWTACKVMKDRAKCGELLPPDEMKNLSLIGLRTCAVADNPVVVGNLREPFASSGFWLAPMIVGFPSVFLRFKKNRSGHRRS